MVMSWIWTGVIFISIIFGVFTGRINEVSTATATGAQSAITVAIGIAGSICLWTGVGHMMEQTGLTAFLSKILHPVLQRIFPGTRSDPQLGRHLSANVCANILGLGNAATPMGIQAVKRMISPSVPDSATDEMCRLVVLNTASIQLIPSSVAAVRAALGCGTPFDILPAVWITSLCSAGVGLIAAWLLGKLWRNG